MEQQSITVEELQSENHRLLSELEYAYSNMERVLEQSAREQKITYTELEEKYEALEQLYRELTKKENMLIHLEKMSSIGQFVSEIIHELNNPLTVISGSSGLLINSNLLPNSVKYVERIIEQVNRMSRYLNRFKAMVYKGKEDFTRFDLNSTLRDFIDTIEIIKPKSIQMETNLYQKLIMVEGDSHQINQVFLNLAKNAFDAIGTDSGTFKVSSYLRSANSLKQVKKSNTYSCQEPGTWKKILNNKDRFAVVEFADSGAGIRPELMQNIFEAFFTTKERDKGTGLGLSICMDITKRHCADLSVRSQINKGTTFTFTIPTGKSVE